MGRPKAIPTPERMLELFEQYEESVKSKPKQVNDFRGKDATEVTLKKERPLTWMGFQSFLYKNKVQADLDEYRSNYRLGYGEFTAVVRAIEAHIASDVIDGGATSIYQQSVSAHLLGWVAKNESQIAGIQPLFPDTNMTIPTFGSDNTGVDTE